MTSNRPEFQAASRPTVSPRGGSKLGNWLRREAVALLGVSGAGLTLLAELANVMPMAPTLAALLARWRSLTESVWRPPFEVVGVDIHPAIAAALTIAVFLIVIGVGGRISAAMSGAPLPPLSISRFWSTDDQTWPSLLAFGAVCLVFLLGRGSVYDATPLRVFGSEQAGEYAFAIIGAAGYLIGSFIGEGTFHRRLIRLMLLVAVVAAVNWAVLALT